MSTRWRCQLGSKWNLTNLFILLLHLKESRKPNQGNAFSDTCSMMITKLCPVQMETVKLMGLKQTTLQFRLATVALTSSRCSLKTNLRTCCLQSAVNQRGKRFCHQSNRFHLKSQRGAGKYYIITHLNIGQLVQRREQAHTIDANTPPLPPPLNRRIHPDRPRNVAEDG